MGVLTRLVLVSMLFGCTPVDCDIDRLPTFESIEHVSLFNSGLEHRSRNAAVKIVSFDAWGNKISGSGAYVTYKGEHYILTAAHVVDGSPTAMITGDKEIIIGDVVFMDSYSDVALVSIAGMMTKEPVRWRVARQHNIGDEIIYSGYPNSMDGFMTVVHSYIWKGASGSLVLDRHGKIVGVVSAVSVGTDLTNFPTIIEDIGLIVPVGAAEEFLKDR